MPLARPRMARRRPAQFTRAEHDETAYLKQVALASGDLGKYRESPIWTIPNDQSPPSDVKQHFEQ